MAVDPTPEPAAAAEPTEVAVEPAEEQEAIRIDEKPVKLDLVDAATLVFGFFLFLSFVPGLLPGS